MVEAGLRRGTIFSFFEIFDKAVNGRVKRRKRDFDDNGDVELTETGNGEL